MKQIYKSLHFSPKIILELCIFALLNTLSLQAFFGAFVNSPSTMDDSFSAPYWYYINRGLTMAWNGVVVEGTEVAYPHIKMPLHRMAAYSDGNFVKIIDIELFLVASLPIFLGYFVLGYLLSFIQDRQGQHRFPLAAFGVVSAIFGVLWYLIFFGQV